MWEALFKAIKSGFDFFGRLLSKKEEIDAERARAGTAAGAAANEASHKAGPPPSKPAA